MAIFRFLLLLGIKYTARLFFSYQYEWVGGNKCRTYKDHRLVVLLNHTSLYEPLLLGAFPNSLLWEMAARFCYPVASKTLNRPLVGRFFRLLAADTISLTRLRDSSWENFLEFCEKDKSLLGLAPEGRMKRATGLDKDGNPMTLKSGIADVLDILTAGKVLVLYSGGLHHIQSPGKLFPKLFKRIKLRFESLDIADYKDYLNKKEETGGGFRHKLVNDLEQRRDFFCSKPWPKRSYTPDLHELQQAQQAQQAQQKNNPTQ